MAMTCTWLQVLDFYKRLSKALGETLANADDMQEDGGRLQQVPIVIVVVIADMEKLTHFLGLKIITKSVILTLLKLAIEQRNYLSKP